MTKLEKVIKGLRHCYNRKCDGCPYGYTDEHGFKICQQMEMIGDALELLKEQEAMHECLQSKCVICPHCSNCDVDENGLLKEQPHWISVKDRLPEENKAVNVVWVNREPKSYYQHIKDKPFVASAVFFRNNWYWWSVTIEDVLAEYGRSDFCMLDESIEITHWMSLPEPPKEDEE